MTMKLAHSIKMVGFLAALLAVLTLAVPSSSWAHDGQFGRGRYNGYYNHGGYGHRHNYWGHGYGYSGYHHSYYRPYYSQPLISVGLPGFSLFIGQ